MRRFGIVVVILVMGLVGLGCGETHEERVKKWNEAFGKNDSSGGLFGRKSGDTETWTIECNAYGGPARKEMADRMAAGLKRVSELSGGKVWVEQRDNESAVYYGEYPLKYVAAKVNSAAHAQGDVSIELNDKIKRDLEFIKTLAMGEEHPFFSARPIPKPIEDVGPPEWDLRNAKGVYTLQVGVTYNTPTLHNYKQAAVEWVKALRDDGREAYYYHSPTRPLSSVCVGTFGDDALIEWQETVKDPETGEPQKMRRVRYGEAVEALRNQDDFRYNLENGHKISRSGRNEQTGAVAKMPNESYLMKIPAKGGEPAEGPGN